MSPLASSECSVAVGDRLNTIILLQCWNDDDKTLAPIDYCRAENVIKRLNADAKLEESGSHSSDWVGA
mgnify:CR=1 FL=1